MTTDTTHDLLGTRLDGLSSSGGGPCADAAHAVDLPSLRRRTRDLLHAHVPLTLLLDLADPAGPHSAAVYAGEGGDAGWLRAG